MSRLALNTGAAPEPLLNGRYQVVEVLSNVGWGRTYIAVDTHQVGNPKCVVKQIQPVSNEPDCLKAVRRLFYREAKILETLSHHDQVSQLLAFLEVDATFYLVREFIAGQPLSAELAPGQRWSENQVIQLLEEVLGILAFVHSHWVIHGDLQPDKLIRRQQDGKLVLTGFNAINQLGTELVAVQEQVSKTVALGTLGYMAMEQVRGRPRPSSDIYSLGMIGIQALTGLNPMQLEEDPQTGEIVWQHQAMVSEELAAILTEMVRYHFKDRYHSANDVLKTLQPLVQANASRQLAVPSEPPALSTPLSPTTLVFETETIAETAIDPTAPEAVQISEPLASTFPAKKRHLMSVGAAGVATSLAFGAGGYFLMQSSYGFNRLDQGGTTLAQAGQKYQAGELQEAVALAQSISSNSAAYNEAQTAIAQWQKDWQNAQTQFEVVKKASAESQWSEVLKQARLTPNIAFWQQKIEPLVQQAQVNLDREAYQLLQQAYNQATDKDFEAALNNLKRIPEGTRAYPQIQAKIAEYTEKQRLKGDYLLQQAYSRAVDKDFKGALPYLKKIPKDTPAYAKAQQKIAEYTQKQQIKANYLLQRAYDQAIARNFTQALDYLKQVPEDAPTYPKVREKILEYTEKQRFTTTAEKAETSTIAPVDQATTESPFRLDPFTGDRSANPSNRQEQSLSRYSGFSSNLDPGNHLQEVSPQPSMFPGSYPASGGDDSERDRAH